jgi:hypothetical protein
MTEHLLTGIFGLFDSVPKKSSSNVSQNKSKERPLLRVCYDPPPVAPSPSPRPPSIIVPVTQPPVEAVDALLESVTVPEDVILLQQHGPTMTENAILTTEDDIHPDDSVSQISFNPQSMTPSVVSKTSIINNDNNNNHNPVQHEPSSIGLSSAQQSKPSKTAASVVSGMTSTSSRTRASTAATSAMTKKSMTVSAFNEAVPTPVPSSILMPPPPPPPPSTFAPSAQYTAIDPSAYTPSIIAQQATLNQLKEEYARQLRSANEEHIKKLRMANEETMKFYHLADAKRREADDSLGRAHKLQREIERLEAKLHDSKRRKSALRDENRMLRSTLSTSSSSISSSSPSIVSTSTLKSSATTGLSRTSVAPQQPVVVSPESSTSNVGAKANVFSSSSSSSPPSVVSSRSSRKRARSPEPITTVEEEIVGEAEVFS